MSSKAEGKGKKAAPAAGEKKANGSGKAEAKAKPVEKVEAAPAPENKEATGNSKGGRGMGIKRNIKPDIAERDAELEAINVQFNKIKAERDEVSKKMRELRENSKGGNEERQKVRAELNKIKDELQKVRDEKDAVVARQKNAMQAVEAKIAEERKAKDAVGKFSTVEAIDAEVAKIEKRMMDGKFSAKEEKDMIREMDKLKMSKKNIGAIKSKMDEVAKAKEHKKEIDALLNEKRAAVDEVQKRYQNVRDVLVSLDEKDKAGIGAEMPKLREKHDALNVQLDELVKKRNGVYEAFSARMKEFIEAEKERRRLEAERRAAEDEKRRLEQEEYQRKLEEKRKKEEEEEAKKKPWEAEIALCDYLIGYLQRLSLKSSQSSASGSTGAQAASAAPKRAGTDFGNLKPLVRDQDDAYVKLGADKKKKEKPVAPKADKSASLVHTLDTLNSFALLSLIPPSNEGEIDASVNQLKEKRAYYDVLPRAPKACLLYTSPSPRD